MIILNNLLPEMKYRSPTIEFIIHHIGCYVIIL